LPPCVAPLVYGHIDNMLEDFVDREEWFFGFDKAPCHEKDDILKGFASGTYRATIKQRHNNCALKLLLAQKTPTLFGPPMKKLRQTTLTQAFPDNDAVMDGMPNAVIDLTGKLIFKISMLVSCSS
jgi:hypothetical protein